MTVLVLGLPQLFALLGLSGVLMLIIESIIGLVLFIAIREWLVRRMWRFPT
ncbi:MAG: hypothetical protein Q9P01_08065 [Anaerolineae bacterium]|nr:hypothetical protein [Anaerolineae bacterium]